MKCNCCEAELDLTLEISNTVRCRYCKEITILPKKNQTNEVLKYLENASMNLFHSEFDKAYDSYQEAIKLDKEEPEAYFGLALASHKIRYIRDFKNDCLQPICYEINNKKFSEDKNYQKALEYSTDEQKEEYIKKAEKIDTIKNKFVELQEKGLDYDGFICVKVTDDETKKETQDSYEALKIHSLFKERGYRLFYSGVYCNEELGSEYEGLILYALYKAKFMIIICGKEEYLQTPWVKNEYTRYITFMNEGKKEKDSIAIACTNQIIETIPGLRGKRQSIDLNSNQSYMHLQAFFDKYLGVKAKTKIPEQSQINYQKNLSLARSACIRKNFEQAREIYEKLLLENPEDINIYIGFVRIASHNYTIYDSEEIDEAIKIVEQINPNIDINELDKEYVTYLTKIKDKKYEQKLKDDYRKGCELYEKEQYNLAKSYFIASAKSENVDAQFKLGYCYDYEKEYDEAVYWYKKVAEQGHASAQFNFGLCYENGRGVKQSYDEAVYWYKKAAEQGHARAQNNLGCCYDKGRGVKRSYDEAVYWYKKAVEQGNARAQCNLGYCYEKGQGVKQSYDEAVYWYKKAAEQGEAMAQCNLGSCYKNGRGVKQSYDKAIYWYKKAAEQGYATAQCSLGCCYEKGQGVNQSYDEAVYWYKKAVEQGFAIAKFNLGSCYENGQGVKKSYKEAVYWYNQAAKQGFEIEQNKVQEHNSEKPSNTY